MSCCNESIKTEYYDSGNLRYKISTKSDKKNGKAIYYYENGIIEEERYYIDDKLSGPFISYHKNGNVNIKLNFIDSLRIGWGEKYLPTGELSHLSENLIIDPDKCIQEPLNNEITPNSINYVNQQIHYTNGEINKSESYFFTINNIIGNTQFPLFNKNKTINLSIKLETPRYVNGYAIFFIFDNDYNLNEYTAEGYVCNLRLYIWDSFLLQGYIIEKDLDSDRSNLYFIYQWLHTKQEEN